MICVICKNVITDDKYGHNPEPFASFEDGRCCTNCNSNFVIPARLTLVYKRLDSRDTKNKSALFTNQKG